MMTRDKRVPPVVGEIEADVPIPESRGRKMGYLSSKNPIEVQMGKLEVGDSFVIVREDEKDRRAAVGAVWSIKKRRLMDKDFTCRQVKEGVRVWRVK